MTRPDKRYAHNRWLLLHVMQHIKEGGSDSVIVFEGAGKIVIGRAVGFGYLLSEARLEQKGKKVLR